MLTQIRKVTIIVLPVVVAVLLLAFFGQPKEGKTVEVAFEPQPGISNVLYTTSFGCANELSLEEFHETHSAETLLVNSYTTSNFDLFVMANDSANTCVKAKLVSLDPTVYGQFVEDYEIDLDKGLLRINVGSSWLNSDGVDSAGVLSPFMLVLVGGLFSVLGAFILWSVFYTRTWR